MLSSLFMAMALMLFIGGVLPFVALAVWKNILGYTARFSDGQIRFFRRIFMIVGLILLFLARLDNRKVFD